LQPDYGPRQRCDYEQRHGRTLQNIHISGTLKQESRIYP
jgi:hypothetical protein